MPVTYAWRECSPCPNLTNKTYTTTRCTMCLNRDGHRMTRIRGFCPSCRAECLIKRCPHQVKGYSLADGHSCVTSPQPNSRPPIPRRAEIVALLETGNSPSATLMSLQIRGFHEVSRKHILSVQRDLRRARQIQTMYAAVVAFLEGRRGKGTSSSSVK